MVTFVRSNLLATHGKYHAHSPSWLLITYHFELCAIWIVLSNTVGDECIYISLNVSINWNQKLMRLLISQFDFESDMKA